MTHWKEKINDLSLKGLISYGTEKELQDFICTEVIEKLIKEIEPKLSPDELSQLRERWLK